MSRTALLVAAYYLGGGIASAIVAAEVHLGIQIVGFALAILYLGHLWWRVSQAKRQHKGSQVCLLCQTKIDRTSSDGPFCCDEHERQWLDELDEIAVRRLQATRKGVESIKTQEPAALEESPCNHCDLRLLLPDT
jgi:hypothetical protein